MGATPHTHAQRGKRVEVILKDGTIIKKKYYDKTSRGVILGLNKDIRIIIPVAIIKSLTIAR